MLLMHNQVDIALYDRDCTLCKRTKKVFERLDPSRKIKWVPLQERRKYPEIPNDIDEYDIRAELHLLTHNQHWLKGYYAVRYMFKRNKYLFWTAIFLYFPFADRIGVPIYRAVANRRYELLKDDCEGGKCEIQRKK